MNLIIQNLHGTNGKQKFEDKGKCSERKKVEIKKTKIDKQA